MIKPYDFYDPFMDSAENIEYPKIINQDKHHRIILYEPNMSFTYEIKCRKCETWLSEEEYDSFLFDDISDVCNDCKPSKP